MATRNFKDAPRVRFLQQGEYRENKNEFDQDKSTGNVHILKHRSSSETSLLLRIPSFNKNGKNERRSSLDMKNNNNTDHQNENYVDKFTKKFSTLGQETRSILKSEDRKGDDTKEVASNRQKKNRNVYSVHEAKTITSQRRRSLPLLNIPKLMTQRSHDGSRQRIVPVGLDEVDRCIEATTDLKTRTIDRISRGFGKLLRRSNSVKISEPDPVYKVAYLGNVLTGWAKGENCIEKPLATLWRNYSQSSKPDVIMKLSVANSGLKGFTKEHGLTEYWSNRITYCASPIHYPKIFCWVYRHEGRKLKHELRCHAVLCAKESVSQKIKEELQQKLHQALIEFKKDKINKQNARLSLVNSVYDNPSMPRRKILLSVGATNYKPPLERSKSAPKLGAIEELCSEEDEEEAELNNKDNSDTWSTKTLEDINENNEFNYTDTDCPGIYSNNIDTNISCCNDIMDLLVKQTILEESENASSPLAREEEEAPTTPTLVIDCESVQTLSRVSNCLVDSDDGSVSSGCETASNVTSSDVEPTSLSCHHLNKDSPPLSCHHLNTNEQSAKTSVCDRIKNFETMFRNKDAFKSISKTNYNCRTVTIAQENNENGDTCTGSNDEVVAEPLGEKNTFVRRCTYPPLKINEMPDGCPDENFSSMFHIFESLEGSDNDNVFRQNYDNESACSDESGYSELFDNSKDSIIGNTIVV